MTELRFGKAVKVPIKGGSISHPKKCFVACFTYPIYPYYKLKQALGIFAKLLTVAGASKGKSSKVRMECEVESCSFVRGKHSMSISASFRMQWRRS